MGHTTQIESMTFNLFQLYYLSLSHFFFFFLSVRVIVLYYKSYYNLIDWFRKYCQIAVVVVVEEEDK